MIFYEMKCCYFDKASDCWKLHQLKERFCGIFFQVTQCAACTHPLELPTVHFLCRHSYHQHCFESFSEAEAECPTCYAENKKILDIVNSQQQSREQVRIRQKLLDKRTFLISSFSSDLFNTKYSWIHYSMMHFMVN